MSLLRAIALGYDALLSAFAVIAGAMLVFFMLSVCLDVGGRYVANRPLGWVHEFTQYGLVYLTFLGMPWLARIRAHVRIDIVTDTLGPGARRALETATAAVGAATCAFAAYWAGVTAVSQWTRDVMTVGIYPIPRAYLIAPVALGLALTAVEFCIQAAETGTGRWRGGRRDG